MDRWTPEEVSAHIRYTSDFATRLEGTGEFVDGQALAPGGVFVRDDGEEQQRGSAQELQAVLHDGRRHRDDVLDRIIRRRQRLERLAQVGEAVGEQRVEQCQLGP